MITILSSPEGRGEGRRGRELRRGDSCGGRGGRRQEKRERRKQIKRGEREGRRGVIKGER